MRYDRLKMYFRNAFLAASAVWLIAGPAAGRSGATYTVINEPEQGMKPIYQLLAAAKKSIDITMFEMADAEASRLLEEAAGRGVKVRVILDQNMHKKDNQATFDELSKHGVQVHWANRAYPATQQKTITVDEETAAILTLSLTAQTYKANRDFIVIEDNPKDIAAIEKTFNADFQEKSVTPSDADALVWSPTNAESTVLKLITSAKDSVFIETEDLSDPAIIAALVKLASKDVWVQVSMTNTADKYANVFDELTAAGADVGTYAPNAPLHIHGTILLTDYGSGTVRAFIGSGTLSTESLKSDRELGVIFNDSAGTKTVHDLMNDDFQDAKRWHNRHTDMSGLHGRSLTIASR